MLGGRSGGTCRLGRMNKSHSSGSAFQYSTGHTSQIDSDTRRRRSSYTRRPALRCIDPVGTHYVNCEVIHNDFIRRTQNKKSNSISRWMMTTGINYCEKRMPFLGLQCMASSHCRISRHVPCALSTSMIDTNWPWSWSGCRWPGSRNTTTSTVSFLSRAVIQILQLLLFLRDITWHDKALWWSSRPIRKHMTARTCWLMMWSVQLPLSCFYFFRTLENCVKSRTKHCTRPRNGYKKLFCTRLTYRKSMFLSAQTAQRDVTLQIWPLEICRTRNTRLPEVELPESVSIDIDAPPQQRLRCLAQGVGGFLKSLRGYPVCQPRVLLLRRHVFSEDISIEFKKGVHVLVLGPNGNVKTIVCSVLLRLWPLFWGTFTASDWLFSNLVWCMALGHTNTTSTANYISILVHCTQGKHDWRKGTRTTTTACIPQRPNLHQRFNMTRCPPWTGPTIDGGYQAVALCLPWRGPASPRGGSPPWRRSGRGARRRWAPGGGRGRRRKKKRREGE